MGLVTPALPKVAPTDPWLTALRSDGAAKSTATRDLHDLLLKATRHQVWRLKGMLGNAGASDLEDLAQQAADDALIDVLRKLDTFEGRSRFSTWCYKFGVFHAGNTVRREAWRGREVPLPDSLELPDTTDSPEAKAIGADLEAALTRAIDDLTPHQRRVALALIVEQVPIDVLADRLESNRNALYKTLHDARRRLRVALAATGHVDLDGSTAR